MEFYLFPSPPFSLYLELDRAKKEKKRLRNVVVLFLKADRPIKRKAEVVEAKKKRENESLAGIMDSTDGNISRPTL